MKPDKHKQKRTQQYKKKHGLSTDKETQSKSRSLPNEQKKQVVPSQKPSLSSFLPDLSPSQSDDDDDRTSSHRSRVLQSNWERYEELPQEADDITSRGADFSTLLQSSSSAVSQFRFADELALDEDISDTQTPAHLTIEPNQLVAALACIPLHKKLNLDEKYFEKDYIELFINEAATSRKLYDQESGKRNLQQTTTVPDFSSAKESLSYVADDMDLDSVLQGVSNVHDNINSKHNSAKLKSEQSGMMCDIVHDLDDLLSGERSTLPEGTEDNSSTSDKVCVSKSNYDTLLEDQRPSQSAGDSDVMDGDVPVTSLTEDVKNITNIEDELDKLLSLDDDDGDGGGDDGDGGVVTVIRNHDKQTSEKVNCVQEESKDLEDWLDSVLDD